LELVKINPQPDLAAEDLADTFLLTDQLRGMDGWIRHIQHQEKALAREPLEVVQQILRHAAAAEDNYAQTLVQGAGNVVPEQGMLGRLSTEKASFGDV
jgi:hypothetical protein